MIAIDVDYETSVDENEWKIQYWWPDRCWRWVRVSRVQFGRHVPPVDMDAQMEPEPLPEPSADKNAGRKPRRSAVDGTALRLHSVLTETGAATVSALARTSGVPRTTVDAALRRRPDLFRLTGELRANKGPSAPLWAARASSA